jgi:predicted dehydrogenase
MNIKKIRVSIIGNGIMCEEYIKVFKSIDAFKTISIVGRNNKKKNYFQKKYKINNFFTNINEMIKYEIPNLIIVATSVQSTYTVLKIINKFKILTIIEKPIGYNFTESNKLKKILNSNYFYIALNRRFYSNIQYVERKIHKSDKPVFINIIDQENNKILNKKKYPLKVRKNWMYANSIHLIDLINYFMRGEITKIKLITKEKLSRSVFIETNLGDKCIYTAIWNKPGPWNIQVSTNNNYFNFKKLENLEIKNFNNKFITKKMSKIDHIYKPGLYLMLKEAIKLVKGKKHNIPNIDYSYNLMNLIYKLYDL